MNGFWIRSPKCVAIGIGVAHGTSCTAFFAVPLLIVPPLHLTHGAAATLPGSPRAQNDLPVRAILGISCLLLGVAMLSCRVEGPANRTPTAGSGSTTVPMKWVRTVDGWERPESWHAGAVGPPRLHPLVVAAGQTLLSVLGLVACSRDDSAEG